MRGVLLAAFLAASGLPLAVFWAWPYRAALEAEEAAVRERHLVLAVSVAEGLGRYRSDLLAAFEAHAPALAAGPPSAAVRALLARLHIGHACAHGLPDGALRAAVDLAGAADCPARLDPPALAGLRALAEDGPGRLGIVEAGAQGGMLFRMAWTDGEALVWATFAPAFPRRLVAAVSFGEKGHAVVVDGNGRVIAHPRPDWAADGRDLSALAPVRRVLAGESGVDRFVSPTLGVEVIAGFAPVPGSRWGVLTPQPVAELTAGGRSLAAAGLAILGAGMVLSMLVALALSRHLSRGLRSVTQAALRMARGENRVRLGPRARRGAIAELALLGRAFDIMARRIDAAHARISTLARFDGLTGLSNRGAFFAEAAERLAQGGEFALFFIDVDRFKAVNDVHGHIVGDALLARIARRLERVAGPGDLVARHSGDEFLVLRPCREEETCAALGARLLHALNQPEMIGGRRIALAVSIGVARFPRDARDASDLVVHADRAMYEAKRTGRNQVRVYDQELRRRVEEDLALRRALEIALGRGEIRAAFQPVIRACDGALAGFEALARWTSPSLGPVSAERFVRVAEDSGLIIALGRAIRMQAFAFAARLRREGAAVPVSVNVSELELVQRGFVPAFEALLAEHRLPPEAIALELTESLFLDHGERELDGLMALRARGVRLALDDFGKGFSSHGRLRTYPVDRLKIDLDFAGPVATDPQARAVVQSLVALGRRLSMTVTVEGVETAEERALAVAWGADELQGYFHHPPLDPEAALALAAGRTGMGAAPVAQAG